MVVSAIAHGAVVAVARFASRAQRPRWLFVEHRSGRECAKLEILEVDVLPGQVPPARQWTCFLEADGDVPLVARRHEPARAGLKHGTVKAFFQRDFRGRAGRDMSDQVSGCAVCQRHPLRSCS